MDSTYSTTGDASSKEPSWARDQISHLVQKIRLDRHEGASLNSAASGHDVARTIAQRGESGDTGNLGIHIIFGGVVEILAGICFNCVLGFFRFFAFWIL